MIVDGLSFRDATARGPAHRAVLSFLNFIEHKLGVTIMYDRRRLPWGRDDLSEPMRIAAQLKELNIIKRCDRTPQLADEVPLKLWWCELEPGDRNNAGGGSPDDDVAAVYSTLAESLERYIWFMERDFFAKPQHATVSEISAYPFIAPSRFTAFSEEQRERNQRLTLEAGATYLWIQGDSLVTGKRTYIPAQTVTAAWNPRHASPPEPIIRTQVTTGLATWPTRVGAQLRGALECVERDAYMIWWFNQMVLPRADITPLCELSSSLKRLVDRCEKYRLRVHVIPLLTDAPSHAVCVVVEDLSSVGPRFAFGLKAHRSLTHAVEGALMEALRARSFTRSGKASDHYDPSKGVDGIGHRGRVHYWEVPENATHLQHLLTGELIRISQALWEHDSEEEHLGRVVRWCQDKGYELVSVPFTASRKNPTQWHIESVVMPELTPTHLMENLRHLNTTRLKSVPEAFGYTPLERPFTLRPHPFC